MLFLQMPLEVVRLRQAIPANSAFIVRRVFPLLAEVNLFVPVAFPCHGEPPGTHPAAFRLFSLALLAPMAENSLACWVP